MVDHCVVGYCADKAQGPLGADQQVAKDVQRFVEIHQGVE